MHIVDTNDLAALVLGVLPTRYKALASPADVAEKLKDLLHGEKNLVAQWHAGIITPREAASVALAHVHSWLISRRGIAWEGWNDDDASREVERWLLTHMSGWGGQ